MTRDVACAPTSLRMNKLFLLSLRWRCAFIHVAPLALRSGLRQEGMVCCLIFTQRLSLVPRCGTREHTGLTCGRASGALSIADRRSIGAIKSRTVIVVHYCFNSQQRVECSG
jgi:hypothetical protein